MAGLIFSTHFMPKKKKKLFSWLHYIYTWLDQCFEYHLNVHWGMTWPDFLFKSYFLSSLIQGSSSSVHVSVALVVADKYPATAWACWGSDWNVDEADIFVLDDRFQERSHGQTVKGRQNAVPEEGYRKYWAEICCSLYCPICRNAVLLIDTLWKIKIDVKVGKLKLIITLIFVNLQLDGQQIWTVGVNLKTLACKANVSRPVQKSMHGNPHFAQTVRAVRWLCYPIIGFPKT